MSLLRKTDISTTLLLLAGAIWAVIKSYGHIPADAAWLTHAAVLFLDGLSMKDAYFDTNPPMSFLIYLPAALLQKAGLTPWLALYSYGFALMGMSAFLSAALIKKLDISPSAQKIALYGFFGGLLVSISFCEKDWLIALMLFPFLLAQVGITRKVQSKWMWAALIVGVPFILVKPHYGLLPTLVILHRFYVQRRWSVIKDPDFVCLALGVILYGLIIKFVFPDFIEILPAIMAIYVYDSTSIPPDIYKISIGFFVFSACMAVLAHSAPASREDKNLSLLLILSVFVSTFIFLFQGKGFFMHLTEAIVFFIPAMLLTVNFYCPFANIKKPVQIILALGIVAISAALPVLRQQMHFTHNEYRNSDLAQFLKENTHGNGFLVEAGTTSVFFPLSLYTDIPLTTRFSSLWFLHGLTFAEATLPEGERPHTKFFADMVAEDINTRKPDVLLLLPEKGGWAFLNLLAKEPELAKAMRAYKKQGIYEFDYRDMGVFSKISGYGATTFDVYVRK